MLAKSSLSALSEIQASSGQLQQTACGVQLRHPGCGRDFLEAQQFSAADCELGRW